MKTRSARSLHDFLYERSGTKERRLKSQGAAAGLEGLHGDRRRASDRKLAVLQAERRFDLKLFRSSSRRHSSLPHAVLRPAAELAVKKSRRNVGGITEIPDNRQRESYFFLFSFSFFQRNKTTMKILSTKNLRGVGANFQY